MNQYPTYSGSIDVDLSLSKSFNSVYVKVQKIKLNIREIACEATKCDVYVSISPPYIIFVSYFSSEQHELA